MKLYYKYFPIERISYLKDELIRFTQPMYLNDPFECLPAKPSEEEFNKASEQVADLCSKQGIPTSVEKAKLTLQGVYEKAYSEVNNDIGILSLTKNWNNALMWAHYTNSHKGFCVGFDSQHSYFNNFLEANSKQSKNIMDVVYSDKRVKIPMSTEQASLNFEPYITKSVDWKYEEEVRVIATLNLSEEKKESPPIDIYLFRLPHTAIKEIIVGANIINDNEKFIKDFCSELEINFFKSKISDTTFNMERY